ncbi:hypothetical protein [uncultured Zhongshania sp.]|jgi:hypothetical protein|uniref:hypothetical protein n=1 Tax=uncultured Zhongshania sp. TaxID=1642288 RepID=UPI0025F61F16|nr:hypothetical protein [uncultured Zhongshania sp.]|tara:strand:+ start:2984 stop:4060 length:1077 start_codon:yes stop_codon:yes gene_type:complete
MRFSSLIFLSSCFFVTTSHAQFAPEILSLKFESQSYSAIASIDQTIHDLEGKPVKNGNIAFTHNQLEASATDGKWEYSLFQRYDYFLRFNSDTAELAYLLRNDIPVPENRVYSVHLRPNHIRAWGLGLAHQFDITPSIDGKIRFNYLRADKTTDGYLKGQFQSLSTGYQTQLRLDYGYSRDTLLDRKEEDTDGHGASVDIDLEWQATKNIAFSLKGRDILSYIKFKDLTYTQANADTNTISFDSNGAIDTKPTVSGIEGYRGQTQRLPHRYTLGGRYDINDNTGISSQLLSYDKIMFPRLGYTSKSPYISWHTDYDFRSKAIGIGIRHPFFSFSIRSDSLKWENAQMLELSISSRIVF